MSSTPNRRSSEHLELIFEIYTLIPTTRKITVTEIHQALSDKGIIRTKRTIQRYLDSLLSYFEIEQDTRSQPYGYRRTANSKLALGPREHMVFLWAETYLKTLLPRTYHLMLDCAFTPLKTLSTQRKLFDIRPPVAVCSNETNIIVFETLCTAVFYQREVRLSLMNVTQSLYVNPLGFIVEQGDIYLAYQYQDTFHAVLIDEVLSAYLTTFAYHYPNHFSLNNLPLSKTELTH